MNEICREHGISQPTFYKWKSKYGGLDVQQLSKMNFAKQDSTAFSKKQIADYGFLRMAHQKMNEIDGKQLGNPDKVANTFIELVESQNPPRLLFLGSDAHQRTEDKITQLFQQIEKWKDLSTSEQ